MIHKLFSNILEYHHSDFNDDGDEIRRVFWVEPENFDKLDNTLKLLEDKFKNITDMFDLYERGLEHYEAKSTHLKAEFEIEFVRNCIKEYKELLCLVSTKE